MKCFASSLPLDTSASSHCGVQRVRDQGLSQALRRCVSSLKRKTLSLPGYLVWESGRLSGHLQTLLYEEGCQHLRWGAVLGDEMRRMRVKQWEEQRRHWGHLCSLSTQAHGKLTGPTT